MAHSGAPFKPVGTAESAEACCCTRQHMRAVACGRRPVRVSERSRLAHVCFVGGSHCFLLKGWAQGVFLVCFVGGSHCFLLKGWRRLVFLGVTCDGVHQGFCSHGRPVKCGGMLTYGSQAPGVCLCALRLAGALVQGRRSPHFQVEACPAAPNTCVLLVGRLCADTRVSGVASRVPQACGVGLPAGMETAVRTMHLYIRVAELAGLEVHACADACRPAHGCRFVCWSGLNPHACAYMGGC
jgi:hypothetical protein